MEKAVKKSAEQIMQEIVHEMQEVAARTKQRGIVFKKVRDKKSSLDRLLRTSEQAKRFMILMKAAEEGLI